MPGSYRYRDLHGHPAHGEIWSPGPIAKTVWVLGPDGPVVVHTDDHRQRRYDWPTFHRDRCGIGGWTFSGYAPANFANGTTAEKLRHGRPAVPKATWEALTAGAYDTLPEPIPGTELIPSWDVPLDLPRLEDVELGVAA